jgi:hypothetical protein
LLFGHNVAGEAGDMQEINAHHLLHLKPLISFAFTHFAGDAGDILVY